MRRGARRLDEDDIGINSATKAGNPAKAAAIRSIEISPRTQFPNTLTAEYDVGQDEGCNGGKIGGEEAVETSLPRSWTSRKLDK